ncbi:hypothetical protein E2C01_067428 [Portunus trituberculatus]|uniref:Uncharacterized protein n=1 Tax=Portunus trituberculatus TaxID=210409 RepID=A0A5B7HKZ0_PORTR|nr:hypothetical protein [Portunus trituberculatus]
MRNNHRGCRGGHGHSTFKEAYTATHLNGREEEEEEKEEEDMVVVVVEKKEEEAEDTSRGEKLESEGGKEL